MDSGQDADNQDPLWPTAPEPGPPVAHCTRTRTEDLHGDLEDSLICGVMRALGDARSGEELQVQLCRAVNTNAAGTASERPPFPPPPLRRIESVFFQRDGA
ncbi:hypothetical protein COCON_G00161010 [Conger conger]|uniref:Uncharacterized protein n=1 Tax=Conger conger TaxID=82655 RepID=A0A9Q1DAZ4_CONCO|nr:hypothetical protein COCON_G00161010 [Conger conger]